jgi:hypothetical protein
MMVGTMPEASIYFDDCHKFAVAARFFQVHKQKAQISPRGDLEIIFHLF